MRPNRSDSHRLLAPRWSALSHIVALALTAIFVQLLPAAGAGTAFAATAANAQSPLGLDLNGVRYYSPEQPFIDMFKMTGVSFATKTGAGWVTHTNNIGDTQEEQYLDLDANGWLRSLKSVNQPVAQQYTFVGAIVIMGIGKSNAGTGLPYRSGQYVVLYDGEGHLQYTLDAKLVSSVPGRDVINVANPSGGFEVQITSTDPNHTGNYLRNIRVVKAEEEALLAAGKTFRPGFLDMLKNFRAMRFMDWLDTNDSPLTTWTSRPHITDAGWGTTHGVPIEVAVKLCNEAQADCWLNVPHKADDDYIRQMATLVHGTLGSTQKVYIEFSNEVWNFGFSQAAYARDQGKALWPGAGNDLDSNRSWFGMRTAQMCDIWKSVYGGDFASRVVCVLGAQAASPYTATQSLKCPFWSGSGNAPCSNHNITAVAIAPYFGNFKAQQAWTSDPDGGLNKLFQELNQGGLIAGDYPGGDMKMVSDWEAAYKTALVPYNLPFIAYEAGQTFVGFPNYGNNTPIVNLYMAANRDPRMGTAYAKALGDWKANGGQLYMHFVDVASPSQYGEWGALESFMDTTTPLSAAPVKWQALQNFISSNPCWWAGCSSSVASVPMAPANLHVVH
ncbi:MAG TPA: hypothetical protein VJQ47_13975 [Steroidobacteraceae bacterium]|nr:hypothetical protein [Steroidobacteraceae bacterium]